MEISYKREMKHNYLVIEEETADHNYEVRMMADNVIEGLMKFRVKRVDNQCCYCYEITSRQPLSRLLENKCLKAGEVRLLILSLAKTLGRLEEYLLKEEQILLQPDYIYVEPELFSVEFCLIPGRKSDFPAELGKLLEYLLGKVDYQDKACVVMTYGMYRESLKDNYGIDDLLKFLTNAAGQDAGEAIVAAFGEEPVEEAAKEVQGSRHQPDIYQKEAGMDHSYQPFQPYQVNQRKEPGKEEEYGQKKLSWKAWLRQKLEYLRGRKEEKVKKGKAGREISKTQESELPWQMVFAEEPRPVTSQDPVRFSNDIKSSPVSREYEEPEGPNTVLLYDKEEKQLRRLVSMEAGVPDIVIAYYPFIIGKQENLVDYVMTQETVSRLHLRIDENDGVCQITDLNSTNGTGVAGRILENNESVVVNPGDEVTVAGLRFKFG